MKKVSVWRMACTLIAAGAMLASWASSPAAPSAGSTAPAQSINDWKSLYDKAFPYYGQALTPKMWDKQTDPVFSKVIQHLSRSTNAVWTETSKWDGDNSQVNLSKFIGSDWGVQTAKNWYPFIATVIAPNAEEKNFAYWPRESMNPALIKYWKDLGLTKIYEDNAPDNINDDYYVYFPNGADKNTAGHYPLVILFHGGGEAASQVETFGFCPIGVKEGLFLLAAEAFGTGANRVGNMDGIVSKVLAAYPMIDKTRIYTVGSSMGGSSAGLYAFTHTTTVAATAIMDQPVSLNTIANNPATEQQVIDIQKNGMPTVFVGGLADMYGLINVRTRDYFLSHEGSSPNAINTRWPDYIGGFNMLMKAYGIKGKDLADGNTRLSNADKPGTLEVTQYTGYPFDKSSVSTAYGVKVYSSGFTGQERLLSIVVENRPHMPSGYDAQLIWNFISQWKRDLATGQSIKR
jgi:pimeloyl-ACP methyl ester carboxylesterase